MAVQDDRRTRWHLPCYGPRGFEMSIFNPVSHESLLDHGALYSCFVWPLITGPYSGCAGGEPVWIRVL
jgi:hypothetical protein